MARNIYALLVGIIDYDETIAVDNGSVAFPRLNGCINDAQKVHSFLKDNAGPAALFVRELYNSEATKDRICSEFLEFLGQAKTGDTVFFYYSGHGAQEIAGPCWTSETDGRLESLACYYNSGTKDHFLLADKELRYLIGKVAANGAMVTMIMDCCHSGDATRNAEIVTANYPKPVEKKSRGSYTFSTRKWTDFIFHDRFTAEELNKKGINTLLPEGAHILFSAAESNQSAYEIAGEGIFTKYLINILKVTNGYISNQSLYDRLSLSMKYAYEQTPRLYTPAGSDTARTAVFLGGQNAAIGKEGTAAAWFNTSKGWLLNRGELSGLSEGMEDMTLIDANKELNPIKAKVTKVLIDHSILLPPAGTDIQRTWFADLSHLSKKAIKLYLSLSSAIPKDASSLIEALAALQPHSIVLVENEVDADYTLQHLNGMFYLTAPNDKYRPVSQVIAAPNFEELVGQLTHISSFNFIQNLSKKQAAATSPVLIEYNLGETGFQPLPDTEDNPTICIDNWNRTGANYSTTLRMRLTNKSGIQLYVALLYLDVNFASGTTLLEQGPCLLQNGQSVDLHVDGDPLLSVDFNEQAIFFNNNRYTEKFKVIANDKPFEIYPLKLDPLPVPPLPGTDIATRAIRGITRSVGRQQKPFAGYFIRTVDVITVNPSFNKIPDNRLTAMLNDKVVSQFAEGLYFTTDAESGSGQLFDGDLTLQPGMEIMTNAENIETDVERGKSKDVVIDLANWWARRKRHKYYDEIIQRFPERTRIVSEGDSWFQHPLVYDIIDHLSKIYAIHCVAAAGDTLSNYLSGEKKRGEYFLDILREDKPPVFLISGGGNDILGSQFKEFLIDDPYKKGLHGSSDGSNFLKPTFAIEIKKLMDIYDTVFTLLKTELPQMVIVVHGYDYPVHLDYTNKGWLGRYMIEKGITGHADRQTIIHYILDEFNTKLGEVAGKFPDTVRYLDLRGTVLFKEGEIDQWYDEIHPNTDGFQSIGLKFIRQIEAAIHQLPPKT